MFVLKNEERRKKKKRIYFLEKNFFFFWLMGWHGPCQPSGKKNVFFFSFEGIFFSFQECGGFGFWSMT